MIKHSVPWSLQTVQGEHRGHLISTKNFMTVVSFAGVSYSGLIFLRKLGGGQKRQQGESSLLIPWERGL